MFFEEDNTLRIIGGFLRKAEIANINDEVRSKRLSITKEIVSHMHKSPKEWDERCSVNIEYIGHRYLQLLNEFKSENPENIDAVYSMSYRFLCEFDFLVGAGKELNMDLVGLINKIQEDNDEMDDIYKSQIRYATFFMPANIAKRFINDSNIADFRAFEQKKNEAEKLKEQWDKEIEEKNAEATVLKDKLIEYKIGFNFVGLHQGFSNLGAQRDKEAKTLFVALILMGLLVLAPLFIESIIAGLRSYSGESLRMDHLFVLLPLLSIELILIYFFRIILFNHRSVKAQKMQIDLRQTLCQFIQSYAEYSAKIKKQDSVVLDKFENLIFSGILSDPEKLPSTFDGLEKLGELIKNVRGS